MRRPVQLGLRLMLWYFVCFLSFYPEPPGVKRETPKLVYNNSFLPSRLQMIPQFPLIMRSPGPWLTWSGEV